LTRIFSWHGVTVRQRSGSGSDSGRTKHRQLKYRYCLASMKQYLQKPSEDELLFITFCDIMLNMFNATWKSECLVLF